MLAAFAAAAAALAMFPAARAHDHPAAGAATGALADTAADCVKTGEACAAHCIRMLAAGDREMAECLSRARQTVAICAALVELASLESPHLRKAAAAALDICRACEDECRRFESKHPVCKACADACAACAEQCRPLAA